MKVSFISLGCAKNTVNAEQMMALCRDAGMELLAAPEGADVVVINTCGFIDSAKSEAIDNIIAMGELKAEGQIGKILVTGCLSQRYKEEILTELPEVDGVLGTGSYSEIVSAIEEVTGGGVPCRFGSIHAPVEELDRVLTTPPYIAYLRIAEGCDNHCAYCVIPSLRGKFRSRTMDDVLYEARVLAHEGVKEMIVVAQDTSRYGTDLGDGRRLLPQLLKELCAIEDLHWVRLHYVYPDEIDEELIDVIASEPKIVKYLDIPIQHCNSEILERMNRRGNGEYLRWLLTHLREKIPGLVLRSSIITGLPGEGDEEFTELCQFLKDMRMERVGAFPFSPQEGSEAAKMEYPDFEVAQERAQIIEELQSRIMDDWNDSMVGKELEVLVDGYDEEMGQYFGRSYADSPDVDGRVWIACDEPLREGNFVMVHIDGSAEGELTGYVID